MIFIICRLIKIIALPIHFVFTRETGKETLKNGTYLAISDSFGDQEIGYSTSADGIHRNRETRIKIQSTNNSWAEPGDHATRTPLCAIEEDDGTYTVVYTALTKADGKNFYAIGKCTLAWK